MSTHQKYGIKYPFSSNNDDNILLDVNGTYMDGIKSQVLHVLFTPKGQKIRDPEFGTNLIKFIFEQGDETTLNDVKNELTMQIKKYVPNVEFRDVKVFKDDTENNGIVVMVEYGVKVGNKVEVTTVGVKL